MKTLKVICQKRKVLRIVEALLFRALFTRVCNYLAARRSRSTEVSRKAELIGKKRINLSKGVRIYPFAQLDARAYGKGRITIGENSEIHSYSLLHAYGGQIEIGKNCSVNPFCVLYGHGGLRIGDMVRIATHTVIIPANHGFKDLSVPIMYQKETRKGININDNVWIGAGAMILDGVTIGEGAVVGAGAVVTADVAPMTIVAGSPAKAIGWRTQEETS